MSITLLKRVCNTNFVLGYGDVVYDIHTDETDPDVYRIDYIEGSRICDIDLNSITLMRGLVADENHRRVFVPMADYKNSEFSELVAFFIKLQKIDML